ncbi:MAG: sulfur carrier protein ThiS [Proteobacteria bacterium]|nr:sulfur carrier protein ThiS [Pseudomonadota bacterium]
MKILANGEEQNVDGDSVTISELLKINNVEMPEMVSVQLNGEFVDANAYESKKVSDGDEVDFLYLMGGGSVL